MSKSSQNAIVEAQAQLEIAIENGVDALNTTEIIVAAGRVAWKSKAIWAGLTGKLRDILGGTAGAWFIRVEEEAERLQDEAKSFATFKRTEGGKTKADAPEWQGQVLYTGQGGWRSHTRNVELILTHDERVANTLRFNQLTATVEVQKAVWRKYAAPPEWTDADPVALSNWIAQAFSEQPAIEACTVHQAVIVYARQHAYHPVRDYLTGLTWDRQPRLDTWLTTYIGVADTPYHRAVGRCFLIAAVARVMRPGCKVDTMMILEGDQGTLKSTAICALFGSDWFTDAAVDPESKDSAQIIRGKWCIEFAELHGMNKAEVNALKQYLTRLEDRQRDAYARVTESHPRQCVFMGTTNQMNYLRDETGARRFWPVGWITKRIDIAGLKAVRDQLWAEALHRFDGNEPWWFTPAEEELARPQQAERQEIDEWHGPISTWLMGRAPSGMGRPKATATAGEIWEGAIYGKRAALGRPERNRIAAVLRSLGWTPCQLRRDGAVCRGYRSATVPPEFGDVLQDKPA